MRFRKEPVAITADSEQTFHRFIVQQDPKNYPRFLWPCDNDTSQEMLECRMKVHVFCNSPSPAVATYGLSRTASGGSEYGKDTQHFIEGDFYVDDGLKSLSTAMEAIDLLKMTQVPLWLSLLGCLCDQNVYPSVGTIFVHKLDVDDYQQNFLDKSVQPHPVTFRANLMGFPDLPRWLRYTQRSPWHSAYLYGSPTKPGRHVVEVTAYNRKTFEIIRDKIIFNILSATDVPPKYEAEFLIDNVDVEEMLPPEARHNFQVPLQDLWNTQRLSVINVTSALDRGGRVPLPLPGLKEGVFVKVGSVVPFPECLYETQKPQIRQQCKEGQKPVLCLELLASDFRIDWCNVTLVDEFGASPIPRSLDPLEWDEEFNPPSDELAETNYLPDYLLTMLLPLLVALLLCALLTYIMCCRREGVQKRDADTSDIQLVHQQSIFSNTEELRHMASNRDVPRPLSTLPMFNIHTGQRTSPMDLSGDSAHIPLILSQQ